MTKKAKDIEETNHRCKDCINCVPDMTNLTIKGNKPILGSCKYREYKFLINHDYCHKNYESIKKNKTNLY